MKKYSGTEHKTNEFTDYDLPALKKLLHTKQANSLERTDLLALVGELITRLESATTSLNRF